MINLPSTDDALRIADFLQDHTGWSGFWDKRHGVWRVAEDDPCSDLYEEDADVGKVIAFMAAHSGKKAEELASGRDLPGYLAGMWLRELAVKLAVAGDLAVSVHSYEHPSPGQELEVTLTRVPDCGSIMIGRSQPGDEVLITFDRWLSIKDPPDVENVVNIIRSVLSASARPRSGSRRQHGGRYLARLIRRSAVPV